jgi:hypothetical protein
VNEMPPHNHQKVEILIGTEWVPATFFGADSISFSDPELDEVYWMDHFLLDNGDTIPEDITKDIKLPIWRSGGDS